MATPGAAPPPQGGPAQPGMPFSQAQLEQMIAMEAQKRGMTVPQFQAWQRQMIEDEAKKAGMSPQEFVAMKQQEAREQFAKQQQMAQQQAQQQTQEGNGQPQQGQQPQGGPPPGAQQHLQKIDLNAPVEAKPEALAVAQFLRSQDLKLRTCIFDGQRKEMFKVKRAYRAFQSEAYTKARAKNPLLPQITNELEARTALQMLPVNMLALRVGKKDPHEGHDHAPSKKKEKRVKGLWHVKIEGQQEFEPMMHYMWIYEAPNIKTKIYAGLALIAVFTVVLFPLWPLKMRQGVWYLSVGLMGLLGAFFAMAIFRLILFCVTVFTVAPGLWLFPNLFEDVGFFDSFKPVWGWQETKKKKGGKKAKGIGASEAATSEATVVGETAGAGSGAAVTTSSEVTATSGSMVPTKRHAAPTVEEADDE